MKVPMILITDKTLRTISKNLEKRFSELEIRGRIETVQTTALLKSTLMNPEVLLSLTIL